MDLLADNLKFLRKRKSATQEEMAKALDLKKSTYASYESDEGNTPPAKTLYAIAKYFEVTMESLFEINYMMLRDQPTLKISDHEIYFPVSVDTSGTELIDVVPSTYQAQAGYLQEYSDPSFIESLPKISWDLGTYRTGTKRIFQITGDSMLPIPSQSYVLTIKKEFDELVDQQPYIIITNHDILFKRIIQHDHQLVLVSDNPLYPTQQIDVDTVRQYWLAIKVIMDLPDQASVTLQDLSDTLSETKAKVEQVLAKL